MMGGYEMQPGTTSNGTINQMTQVRWYDTTSQSWGMDQATVSNNQPITSRILHTTTNVPGSTKFLIYGGYNDQEAKICQDYAYVYDFMSKEYTPLDLNQTGPGPRAAHSAVGYDTYIMIMFGVDSNMKLQKDFNGLDVSDANHITWTSDTPPTNHTRNDSDNNSTGDNKLSLGGTIGVAIAAAAVFIGIVAATLYFLYRKKQQRQQFQLEKMDPRATNISGSSLDALNAYPCLQKPALDDEDIDSDATQNVVDGHRSPQSNQTTSTMVGSYGKSPFNDGLMVKPSTNTEEHDHTDSSPQIYPSHAVSYELADRSDSHCIIKPHDANI
ncbi:hypothetical protein BCR42DRAFT_219882 [Absidia repens]|uniref:Uncharacterized protein n=1 Tax=Absidia repens TaxID=90262 RepID=A0A1X2INH0_9FUNG|nr:hypothetical protein BCR42DRAFT_219882 [Absidia repens]